MPPFEYVLALELPGIEQVQVQTVQYGSLEGEPLMMDLYYPIEEAEPSGYPVVVQVSGFRTSAVDFRNHSIMQSLCRLYAADGMAAVAFDTERPEDLGAVMEYLKENAQELEIDPERIGLSAGSGGVPTALWYAMQEGEEDVRFLAASCGLMLTPDNYQRPLLNSMCRSYGCYGAELGEVERIRTDLPLFIVRAALDESGVNEFIDHFMEVISGTDVQVTYVEHEQGVHGFEHTMTDDRTVEIIEMTLEFMKSVFGVE